MASVRFEHINKSFGNVEVVHDLNCTPVHAARGNG
jgi:ABC-type sugar transport system ATPase subunit